jgi:hypothetical protein
MTRHMMIKTPSRNARKDPFATELILKELITFIVRFANDKKCDSILIACDSKKVWRKDIYPEYKNNGGSEDIYYDDCIAAANLTKEFFADCTNASVISVPKTEADDIIGVFCAESEGVDNIILSTDRDFIQLINNRTRLYSPAQKKFRETDDADFDLFLKCVRGDRNDNIESAYPRVRETKLRDAWDNPLEMKNILETVRNDGKRVGDVYTFNRKLIDLREQPDHIKQDIRDALEKSSTNNFGELKIMGWLGKNNLKKFASMLEYKERPLRNHIKWKTNVKIL